MSTWHAIVVEGSEKALAGFVAGFTAAAREHDRVVPGSELDLEFENEPLLERVRELIGAGHHLLLAPAPTARLLADALKHKGRNVEIEAVELREIASAHFEFRAETYSRDSAAEIRGQLLGSLPDGVLIEALKQDEQSDPAAEKAELYTPHHDFVYRASATITGPVAGVLEMHRRARMLDFVAASAIRLVAVAP